MIAHLVDPLRKIPIPEVIPATMSRALLLLPADMPRQEKNVPALMPPADLVQ